MVKPVFSAFPVDLSSIVPGLENGKGHHRVSLPNLVNPSVRVQVQRWSPSSGAKIFWSCGYRVGMDSVKDWEPRCNQIQRNSACVWRPKLRGSYPVCKSAKAPKAGPLEVFGNVPQSTDFAGFGSSMPVLVHVLAFFLSNTNKTLGSVDHFLPRCWRRRGWYFFHASTCLNTNSGCASFHHDDKTAWYSYQHTVHSHRNIYADIGLNSANTPVR